MTKASLPHLDGNNRALAGVCNTLQLCIFKTDRRVCRKRAKGFTLVSHFKVGMPMLELEDIVVIWLYCTEGENIDF